MAKNTAPQIDQRRQPASAEEALAPELAGLRQRRIAERAYARAEGRGFSGDQQLDDWFAAEREIDAADTGAREQ